MGHKRWCGCSQTAKLSTPPSLCWRNWIALIDWNCILNIPIPDKQQNTCVQNGQSKKSQALNLNYFGRGMQMNGIIGYFWIFIRFLIYNLLNSLPDEKLQIVEVFFFFLRILIYHFLKIAQKFNLRMAAAGVKLPICRDSYLLNYSETCGGTS